MCLTKKKKLDWLHGESILNDNEIAYEHDRATRTVSISELVSRLIFRYRVANVNIIEMGCQLMPKKDKSTSHSKKKSISVGRMKGGRRVSKKKIRRNRKSKKMF